MQMRLNFQTILSEDKYKLNTNESKKEGVVP